MGTRAPVGISDVGPRSNHCTPDERNPWGACKGRQETEPAVHASVSSSGIWKDRRYEVLAHPNGFEYDGRMFRSLSAVAREITGTRWNGRLFFGLKGDNGGGRHA